MWNGIWFGQFGQIALICRALYIGMFSGADFWKHLRSCMTHLGFTSCKIDPDIWMREAKKDDGTPYQEYTLLYANDTPCISANAESTLRNKIKKYVLIKLGFVGGPKIYLGTKFLKSP